MSGYKGLISYLRYVIMASVVSIGFIALIATGGDSGDSDDDSSCDYNTDIVCDDDCVKECQTNSSWPGNFFIFNDRLIFSAYEGCKNTSQLKLFELDETGSYQEIIEADLAIESEKIELNGVLYFILDGYVCRYGGSGQAEKIFPDYAEDIFSIDGLMAYNDMICFSYHNDTSDKYEFYSYDESSGLELLGYVRAGGDSIVYDKRLYFRGYTEDSGYELWCYDEAGGNLYQVAEINDSGSSMATEAYFSIVLFDERLFFSASDAINGMQLWMIEGTKAPEMVTGPSGEDSGYSWIRPVTVFNDNIICEVKVLIDSEYYIRLFLYDGAGTFESLPVEASYDSCMCLYYGQDINTYTVLDGHFYFLACDTSDDFWNAKYLWDYDGENAPRMISTDDYIDDVRQDSGELLLQGDNRIFGYDGDSVRVLFDGEDLGLSSMTLEKVLYDGYFVTGSSDTDGSELWNIGGNGQLNLVEDFYPGTSCDCNCGD